MASANELLGKLSQSDSCNNGQDSLNVQQSKHLAPIGVILPNNEPEIVELPSEPNDSAEDLQRRRKFYLDTFADSVNCGESMFNSHEFGPAACSIVAIAVGLAEFGTVDIELPYRKCMRCGFKRCDVSRALGELAAVERVAFWRSSQGNVSVDLMNSDNLDVFYSLDEAMQYVNALLSAP